MVERARVLWLIKGLGAGGAENLLVSAAPYLDRDRFAYSVVYLLPWKNALVPPLEEAGISVTCLDQSNPFDPRVVPRLMRLLKEQRVDVLHAHLPYSGIVGRLAAKMAPVKAVVYSEHNVWERYRRPTYVLNRITYGWNDAVIAVSDKVEYSIRSGARMDGRPSLNTIHNGVDGDRLRTVRGDSLWLRSEFGIPAGNRVVVTVANFTEKKRHEDLLKAAVMVRRHREATSFLLVGQGPLEDRIRRQAQQLGLNGSVVFAGTRTDAPRIVASSDLFVLSSQYEGMPISILEAMAVGTPVVATRVGGVPEVITDGISGLLVEAMAPDRLADRIVRALTDEELRRSLAAAAGERVSTEFDIHRMVKRIEGLYARLLRSGAM